MTAAVLAGRTPVIAPIVESFWDRMVVTWQGWDGRVWDLTNPAEGLFLVRGDVRGLGLPDKITHYRDESPAVHGTSYRSTKYGPREVFLPVHLYSEGGSREWHERDSLFWGGLHPEHEGILTVEIPGVSTRRLRLRVEDDGGWAPQMDPGYFGWATYGIRLQADQPLWEGDEIAPPPWSGAGSDELAKPFHGGLTPGAPVLNIGKGSTIAAASVFNPGDVEGWAEWTVHGPVPPTGAAIIVDGHAITVPHALAAGQFVRLDTRPTEQTVVNELGQDVFTTLLGDYDPAPIRPRSNSQISLSVSGGTGSISMRMTPLHLRAW